MIKIYLVTSILGRDEFENDIERLVKPEFRFYADDIYEEISEKWKEAVEEGSQLFIYPTVDAEKTLANQAVVFKFNVEDEDMMLTIRYAGCDG
ncbi:hypothetical protein [Enterococcus hulanensis]|uniref:hypothetical protein n=1 Tax=Enterococcus hulanensis TaxID=2559929 RepID=UPI0010F72C57|nr:hypothetical protein [Enterococcus hulanensis]